MARLLYLFLALACTQVFSSCNITLSGNKGTLVVKAKTPGYFSILPLLGNGQPKLSLKEKVAFNRELKLSPGKYLLLSNCSFRNIEIREQEKITLLTNYILIDTVGRFDELDKLPATCSISSLGYKAKLYPNQAQHFFYGKYTLDFVLKKVPLTIVHGAPVIRIFTNYIIVSSKIPSADHYFLHSNESAMDNHKKTPSPAISQSIGRKLHLPPGDYIISINGSKKALSLSLSIPIKIEAGTLSIIPPQSKLDALSIFPHLDSRHIFDYNQSIPLGIYNLHLGQTDIQHKIKISSFQENKLDTVNFLINPNKYCKEGKYGCKEPNQYHVHDLKNGKILHSFKVGSPSVLFNKPYGLSLSTAPGVIKSLQPQKKKITFTTGILRIKYKEKVPNFTNYVRVEGIKEGEIQGLAPEHRLSSNRYYELLPGEYQYRFFFKPNKNAPSSVIKPFKIKPNKITTLQLTL